MREVTIAWEATVLPRPYQPRFVEETGEDLAGSVIGLEIHSGGNTLVYAPGVATLSKALTEAAHGANCLLLDGTFWTDEEPVQMGISSRGSLEMGHVPVSGTDGSLEWLRELDIEHRVYVHINNTTPMLDEQSEAWQKVNSLGVRIAADGDQFVL